ncbi:MAG: LPS export ABC transporter periplasmic protein LptC [Ignavibacteriales bacterium]|nr:LPS export ABC transporter periplasmic protein LptC [Ignavibacteriales bacterium]
MKRTSGAKVGLLLLMISVLLFGCEDKIKPTVLPGIDSQSLPQQESWKSRVVLSDSGQVKAVIDAGYIRIFDSPKVTLLSEGVTVYFYNEFGKQTSTMTSNEGKVDEATNNLEAYGHVVVVSDDSTRLRTEKLFWDNRRRLIHTQEFVSIASPKEKIQGLGLESDQQLRNYKIFKVSGEAKTE